MTKKGQKTGPASSSPSERGQEIAAIEQLCQSYLTSNSNSIGAREKPILQSIEKLLRPRRRSWSMLQIFALTGITVSLLYIAYFSLPTNLVPALFRLALIRILPYWDWTYLYKDVPCLWKKTEMLIEDDDQNNGTVPEDCMICEDLTKIFERKGGVLTPVQVGEDFLVEQLPLILRRVFPAGPDGPNIQLRRLLALSSEDESIVPCKFRTNLKTKSAFNFHTFLRKVQREDLQIPWFAFWEFCEHADVKECRPLIPRPLELPSVVEIADSFWFFAASNFTAIKHKHVDLSFGVFWFTQLSGTSRIRLDPKSDCQSACQSLEAELQPGDGFLMTTDLFEFHWMPGPGLEVLAIAAGAQ